MFGNHVCLAVTKSLIGGGGANLGLASNAAGYLEGTGTNAVFNNPFSLGWKANDLVVADSGNQRIRAVRLAQDPSGGTSGSVAIDLYARAQPSPLITVFLCVLCY